MPEFIVIRFFYMRFFHATPLRYNAHLVPVPAVTEEIGEAQGGLLGFHRLFLNFGI